MSDTPVTHRPAGANVEPRHLKVAALVLFGAIAVGIVAFALLADAGEPAPSTDATPAIVPEPNSGQAPDDAGDRGGWEQLALLTVMVLTVGGIGYWAVRGGGARARANREAWRTAGGSGHDGAIEH